MNIALVCIAKNEDNYIDEWINYNFKLGFDDIFIYANDWNYTSNRNNVYVTPVEGVPMQIASYNHFIQKYNNKYNWAAFFDVDEFLVLKKHNNIKDFLKDYEDCSAIGINWAIFGNNHHEKVIDNNYNVLSRFTKKSDENFNKNEHVKSIVKLPTTTQQDIHCPNGQWFNLQKQKRTGPYNKPVDWTIAQLNHYCTKSIEEMHSKIMRGRADIAQKRNLEDLLVEANANQIEDLKAVEFFNQ